MKKISLCVFVLAALCFSQCLPGPVSTRVGLKVGINPGTYEPGDTLDNMTGTGTHFGLGMGTDFFNLISLDMGAQFRTTRYGREEPLGRVTHSYNNLYFPIFLSIKAGMLPLISPYVGAGIGINVQFEGTRRWEPDGIAVETAIDGATNAYFILGLGVEFKLIKFRICPEFTVNIKPDSEDQLDKYTDYHLSVGFFYTP